MLNLHIDNIYDVPCDESTNVNTSVESLGPIDSSKTNEIEHCIDICETQRQNRLKMLHASDIHDYDLYYGNKSEKQGEMSSKRISLKSSSFKEPSAKSSQNTVGHELAPIQRDLDGSYRVNTNASNTSSSTATTATLQRRKTPSIFYSPIHYHTSSNLSTGNRPNSRLSSSHNSLTFATSNKADDSIFITQAMSHDALTGREISDFYNVPIDSDIYALPIDVVRPKLMTNSRNVDITPRTSNLSVKVKSTSMKAINSNMSAPSLPLLRSSKVIHGRLKYMRNTRKRKNVQHESDVDRMTVVSSDASVKINNRRCDVSEEVAEPMHMMVDEVKRFYTNLYTNTSADGKVVQGASSSTPDGRNNNSNIPGMKCTTKNSESDRNNNGTSNNSNSKHGSCTMNNNHNGTKCELAAPVSTLPTSIKIDNNASKVSNTRINANRHSVNSLKIVSSKTESSMANNSLTKENEYISTAAAGIASPPLMPATKKFSINLNLKQKICSIFRFRKSYHQSNGSRQCNSSTGVYGSSAALNDKKVKFSTRALPPLPPKGE